MSSPLFRYKHLKEIQKLSIFCFEPILETWVNVSEREKCGHQLRVGSRQRLDLIFDAEIERPIDSFMELES